MKNQGRRRLNTASGIVCHKHIKHRFVQKLISRNIAVSRVIRLWTEQLSIRGSIHYRSRRRFSIQPCNLPSLLSNPGVKRPGRESDYSELGIGRDISLNSPWRGTFRVPEDALYRITGKCTEKLSPTGVHNCTRSARLCMEAEVSLHSRGQLYLFVVILLHSGPTAQIMQYLQSE